MSWTPDRVEQMKQLWAEGLSCSQIARVLGGVSRNAVIGKVHRLGLAGRANPSLERKMQQAASTPRSRKRLPPAEPPSPPNIPPSERVKITDLTYDMCRYPIGDPLEPDFGFCGKKRWGETTPYCAGHHRLCHEPASGKRHNWRDGRRATPESAEPDVVEQMEPEAA